jgi:hypothetical protein
MNNNYNIPISFKVNNALYNKMNLLCQQQGWSVSFMIRQGINALLYSGKYNTSDTRKHRDDLDQW